jgi:hypothetical protein
MLAFLAAVTLWWDPSLGDPALLPHLYPEHYAALDEAAVVAIQHAYDHSQFYEYGGVILQMADGSYQVGVPGTNYRGGGVHIDDTTDGWPGTFIVADYHTHPCMPYTHFVGVFSDQDVGSNDRTSLIGYMGDLCSGVVRRYVPGVTPKNYSFDDGTYGSKGERVGAISITRKPVVVEIIDPMTLKRGKISW